MRYLSLALYTEGPSDQAFLQRVIYRSVVEIGTRLSETRLDVQEAFVSGEPWRARVRPDRIQEKFGKLIEEGAISLLFIHADGGGDANGARLNLIEPSRTAIRERITGVEFGVVPVVPDRETEAWALADPDALASELGWRGDLAALVPGYSADRAEAEPEPKELLRKIQTAVRGGRMRRGALKGTEPIPAGLGDRTSLDSLRRLEAFNAFECDLQRELRTMWGIVE